MTPNGRGHMGIPLTLLFLACAAFAMTGHTPLAGAAKEQQQTQQAVFGPFLDAKIINVSAPATTPLSDEQSIQNLIARQLDAINERDADGAYALTTGTFHEKFESAAQFLSEMRFSYRPVYNHESFRFLDQTETETGGLIQRVEMTYTHGDPVIVIYKLQRHHGGGWGIDSFTILDTEEGQPI